MQAALVGGQQVALGLDGPRAHQHLPVRRAGRRGEGRRRADQLGAGRAQRHVEFGEAQVVADRESQAPDRGVGHHDALAIGEIVGLAVMAAAVGHLGVEQVQLVVTGGDPPLVVDQQGTGAGLAALLPGGSSGRVPATIHRPRSRATARSQGSKRTLAARLGSRQQRLVRGAPWRRNSPATPPAARHRLRPGRARPARWPDWPRHRTD